MILPIYTTYSPECRKSSFKLHLHLRAVSAEVDLTDETVVYSWGQVAGWVSHVRPRRRVFAALDEVKGADVLEERSIAAHVKLSHLNMICTM